MQVLGAQGEGVSLVPLQSPSVPINPTYEVIVPK